VAAGEPAATDEGAALLGRYEQLRLDALAGTGRGWRWGRAVLERRGVAAWLATWTELEVRVTSPVTTVATGPPEGGEQLVAVLAAMALAVATT
jgi:hypothetical protein